MLILAILVVADLVVVPSIQYVYDWLWGLAPLRFSFEGNFATDGVFIAAHLIVGTAMIQFGRTAKRGVSRFRGKASDIGAHEKKRKR